MNLEEILEETDRMEIIVGPFLSNRIRALVERVQDAEVVVLWSYKSCNIDCDCDHPIGFSKAKAYWEKWHKEEDLG